MKKRQPNGCLFLLYRLILILNKCSFYFSFELEFLLLLYTKINMRVKRILSKLIGSRRHFTIEHRILNSTALIGIFLTAATTLTNFYDGLPPVTYYFTATSALYFLGGYLYSITTRNFKVSYLISLGYIILIFTPGLWIINGGSHGGSQYFIYFYLAVLIATSSIKQHRFFTGVLLIIISLLLLFEWKYPNLIIPYSSEGTRFFDVWLSIVLSITAITVTLNVFINIHKKALSKINKQKVLLIKKNGKIRFQKEELGKHIDEKNKLLNIVAHDLRGPFGSVLNLSEILIKYAKKSDDENIIALSDYIHESANRSFHLVEDLIAWIRAHQHGDSYKPVALDPKEVIDEAIGVLSDLALKKNITINQTMPNCQLYADKNMIGVVFRNLISNAIKYTPQGGEISLSSSSTGNAISIIVRDSGIGMTPEKKDSLFQFGKIESMEGTSGETGTGFGLLICKEFIDRHQGRIEVESIPTKGSSVVVTFPFGD